MLRLDGTRRARTRGDAPSRLALALVAATLPACYESHRRPTAGAVDGGAPDAGDADADTLDGGLDACATEACEVAGALAGLRWELPCTGATEWDDVCATLPRFEASTRLRGTPGATYEVVLRFRGVVETKAYDGGEGEGLVRVEGTPSESDWNLYLLRIERPLRRIYLNAGPDRRRACVAVDEVVTVEVEAGARVDLRAEVFDGRQMRNLDGMGRTLLVRGVPPYPDAYDGQFLQMDVLALRRLR